MKRLLFCLLILSVGCAKTQYQDIYKDDILRAQYQAGHKKGYSEGYYDCLITYLEIKNSKSREEWDTETTTDKVIRQMKERTKKLEKEYDK